MIKRLTVRSAFFCFRFTSRSVGEPKVTSLWSVRASPFGVPFSVQWFSASAPPTMSISSVVITS